MAVVVAVGINMNVSLHFQCYVGKCTARGVQVFTKSGVDPISTSPPTHKIELLISEYIFKFLMQANCVRYTCKGK